MTKTHSYEGFAQYLEMNVSQNPLTIKTYVSDLRVFNKMAKSSDVPRAIKKFLNDKSVKDSTRIRRVTTIMHILQYLGVKDAEEMVGKIKIRPINLDRTPDFIYIGESGYTKLSEIITSQPNLFYAARDETMANMWYHSHIKPNILFKVKRSEVQVYSNSLIIAGNSVPMDEGAFQKAIHYLDLLKQNLNDGLWPIKKDGTPVSDERTIRRTFTRYARQAQLDGITPTDIYFSGLVPWAAKHNPDGEDLARMIGIKDPNNARIKKILELANSDGSRTRVLEPESLEVLVEAA